MAERRHTLLAGSPPARWVAASGLAYALAVFIGPATSGGGWLAWSLATASVVVFACLYFDFIHSFSTLRVRALVDLTLMAALGLGLTPVNVAGTTYVVYAAALAPLVFAPRASLGLFALLSVCISLEMAAAGGPNRLVIGAWTVFLIFIVGGGNLFIGERERQHTRLRRAQEEVEQIATVAERERIARDLHDLLGHTLSVIALKSELASKIAAADPARAIAEIREVEAVSREALSEVRAAVEGYRGRGLAGELLRARQALESAGVRLDADVDAVRLAPRQETVLALVLREACTNVVRHARASVCRVALRAAGNDLVLTVHDDGIGGTLASGNGLAGMLERVRAAGGSLDVEGTQGVKVCARIPSEAAAAS